MPKYDAVLKYDNFSCFHIDAIPEKEIKDFVLEKASAQGLVSYFVDLALDEEPLIEHYNEWGFSRLKPKEERFVHAHIKPKFDEGCIFMYQSLF